MVDILLPDSIMKQNIIIKLLPEFYQEKFHKKKKRGQKNSVNCFYKYKKQLIQVIIQVVMAFKV